MTAAAILLFFLNLIQTLFRCQSLFAETLTPHSLYSSDDFTVILSADNLDELVYYSDNSWLVQFYNSWCGHCIKFSPVWKQLAADVDNWSDLIKLGVINCAHPNNTQTCRNHSINTYPTVRFFRANSDSSAPAPELRLSNRESLGRVHQDLLEFLENVTLTVTESSSSSSSSSWPSLQPSFETIDQVRTAKPSQHYHVLVVEKPSSSYGRDLILDLHEYRSWLTVSRMLDHRTNFSLPFASDLQLLDVTQPDNITSIPTPSKTRQGIYESVRSYLDPDGYKIAPLVLRNVSENENEAAKQTRNNLKLVHRAYRSDLESALHFSLVQDVGQKAVIENESLNALIDYVRVIDHHFPFASPNDAFTKYLVSDLRSRRSWTGDEFQTLLARRASNFLSKPKDWYGCKGSRADRRGFTCGLWMVFHTLTVRRYMGPNQDLGRPQVLDAIRGYVRHFFGCSECAQHFLYMAKTMEGNVSGGADEVLWLWKAHNNVNLRIAGDYTQDPAFPKALFPHSQICTGCHFINGTWNEKAVLQFLVGMYSNIQDSSSTSSWLGFASPDGVSSDDYSVIIYTSVYLLTSCFVIVFLFTWLKRERNME